MTLSDIMGAAGHTLWAEIALVICFVAFLALAVFLVATRKSRRWEHLRRLPLEDDDARPGDGGAAGGDAQRDEGGVKT